MMKTEFEDIICRSVSSEDYAIIETVYTWHPSISETDGRSQIARLYTDYGMPVIRDMLPRAQAATELDRELMRAEHVLNEVRKKIEELGR